MGFPRVKSFLFCMSLKTGGYIIGWSTVFTSLIALIVLIIIMVSIPINPEPYFNKTGIIAWMIVLNFYSFYFVLLIFTACIMMRGILMCESHKIIPFMISIILGFIFGFIQICMVGWKGLTPAILGALVDCYMFLCMHSLYKRLKAEENEQTKFIQRVSAISRI